MNDMIKLGLGIVITGVSVITCKKISDICSTLNVTINDLAKNTPVKVEEAIIEKAVEKAVEEEVKNAVKKATKEIMKDVEDDMEKQVRNAVKEQSENIQKSVTEKIASEVSKIDKDILSQKIKKQATDIVVSKFENELDGILNKFNLDLKNISKIYSSIAKNMTPFGADNIFRSYL